MSRARSARFVLGLVALLSPLTQAAADVAPPAKVLSQFETHWGASLGRDCGFSRRLPSDQSLWVFCDTPIYDFSGKLTGFIGGTTAAEGPFSLGLVPTQLVEVPTPPGALAGRSSFIGPAPFLPNPGNLTRADGTACTPSSTGYPAAWASGLAQEPGSSTRLLITYMEVCVDNGALLVEGFGLLEYDAAANTIVAGPTEVFRASAGTQLAAQRQLGSPIFSGGNLFLFASICDSSAFGGCSQGRIFLSKVAASASAWQHGSSYTYWTSASPSWTSSIQRAQSVISGATPLAVTVDSYPGKGLAIIEETSIGGSLRVWKAPAGTFVGSWTLGPTRSSLAGCDAASGLNLCRAFTGHPEISSTTTLLMSYFNPADHHVEVVSLPW
ncbi:MAG TPA: hypothetical protein VHT91_15705 [Kofleriaceae bacterium]|nr:hypothetical protein [Kofleriaceae bacterium]